MLRPLSGLRSLIQVSPTTSQTFDRAEFERALFVLGEEQSALQLTPRQRLSLRLYTWSIIAFIVFLVALVVFFWAKWSKTELSDGEAIAFALLAIGGAGSLVCAVAFLFFNLKLLWKILRGRFRFRRMGYAEGTEILWRAYQQKRHWAAWAEKLVLALGLVILLGGVLLLLLAIWERSLAVIGIVIIGLSIPMLMFYFLRSGKARLEMMSQRMAEITSLQESMARAADEAGDGAVALPANLIEQYSRVETDQIVRTRANAIREAMRSTSKEYSLLSSQQARQAKLGLSSDERSRVEAALDDLAKNPYPEASVSDGDTGLKRLPVAGTGLEIRYSVDENASQVRLASLEASAAAAGGAHA